MQYVLILKGDEELISLNEKEYSSVKENIIDKDKRFWPEFIEVGGRTIKPQEIKGIKEINEENAWAVKIKQSRRNWERLSKMDNVLKVKREIGRFRAIWKLTKSEELTPDIEDSFATIANDFFERNPFRTITDANEFRHLIFPQTKTYNEQLSSILFNQGIEALLINPEGNDIEQAEYSYQYNDEPYLNWN